VIEEQGVKEISLKSYLYDATIHAMGDQRRTRSLLGGLGKHVNAILGRENVIDVDAIHAELTIKVDNRSKNNARRGTEKLSALASDLVSHTIESDDYVIVLRNNIKLSPDEIRLQKLVTVESDGGKTLKSPAIRKELIDFFNELCDSRAVEL
jgi:hypothetical protein